MILRKARVGHSPPRKARALSLSFRCSSLSPKSMMYFHSLYHFPSSLYHFLSLSFSSLYNCLSLYRERSTRVFARRVRDLFLILRVPEVRRTSQLRRTDVPHPNPLPTQGEGIGRRGKRENQNSPHS